MGQTPVCPPQAGVLVPAGGPKRLWDGGDVTSSRQRDVDTSPPCWRAPTRHLAPDRPRESPWPEPKPLHDVDRRPGHGPNQREASWLDGEERYVDERAARSLPWRFGVPHGASPGRVLDAYRQLGQPHHPDRKGGWRSRPAASWRSRGRTRRCAGGPRPRGRWRSASPAWRGGCASRSSSSAGPTVASPPSTTCRRAR